MPFNLSQTEIDEQRRIQDSLFWERRQQEAERAELAKKARREGEEEKRRIAKKPIVYYCTNLRCLVKLEQLSTNKYRCPICSEIFIKDWISVRSRKGIEATSDFKDELKRLEDYREKYLHEAREIKKKLQFLDEWEKMGLTQK